MNDSIFFSWCVKMNYSPSFPHTLIHTQQRWMPFTLSLYIRNTSSDRHDTRFLCFRYCLTNCFFLHFIYFLDIFMFFVCINVFLLLFKFYFIYIYIYIYIYIILFFFLFFFFFFYESYISKIYKYIYLWNI